MIFQRKVDCFLKILTYNFFLLDKNSFKNINKHNEQINDKKGMIIITKKLNSVLNKCVGRIKIF